MSFNIENEKLNNTIEQLTDKCDELESAICQFKSFIEQFEQQTNSLKENFNMTDLNTDDIDIIIDKLSNLLFYLNNKYSNLNTKLHQEINKLDNSRINNLKNNITNITLEQCFVCELKQDTKTIKLLDDFCSSNKDFLILKNAFYLPINRLYVSLIISRYISGIEIERSQPTMTELKKEYGKRVTLLHAPRLQPLRNELQRLDTERTFTDGEIFPFDVPFLIGGQTSSNKTGYGTTWYGWGDYDEGTLYGEVTDFFLTGIVTNSTYFYLKTKQTGKVKNREKQPKKKNTKPNKNNNAKDFPLFLMKNIVVLCIDQHLHPIKIINQAIIMLEKDMDQIINYDKTIHNAFTQYLTSYKHDSDYILKFLYELSIVLNCSIVKIITLNKTEKERIVKKFINDKQYCTTSISMGLGFGNEVYYLLTNEIKFDEKLISYEDDYTDNKFPIYADSTDDVKYYEDNQELFIEDYRSMIIFSSNNWSYKPFKYNLHCSFYIYYHQEYMQYKKIPFVCSGCNHSYTEKNSESQKHVEWLCPICSKKNSIFEKYYFKELYLPSNDDLKKNVNEPIQPQ